MTKIGILGAGKVGIVLAQLALRTGYEVIIAGSGSASKISLSVEVLAPGAKASDSVGVAQEADIIILALPLNKYQTIDTSTLKGKVVIDAMNYWWEVDGIREDFSNPLHATSELIQEYLTDSIVVKAFNHMGYHDLFDESRVEDPSERKAIAVAGDDKEAVEEVMGIVSDFGFDPLNIGSLSDSKKLEPGSEAFGANVELEELQSMMEHFNESELGQEVLEAQKKKQ